MGHDGFCSFAGEKSLVVRVGRRVRLRVRTARVRLRVSFYALTPFTQALASVVKETEQDHGQGHR